MITFGCSLIVLNSTIKTLEILAQCQQELTKLRDENSTSTASLRTEITQLKEDLANAQTKEWKSNRTRRTIRKNATTINYWTR